MSEIQISLSFIGWKKKVESRMEVSFMKRTIKDIDIS